MSVVLSSEATAAQRFSLEAGSLGPAIDARRHWRRTPAAESLTQYRQSCAWRRALTDWQVADPGDFEFHRICFPFELARSPGPHPSWRPVAELPSDIESRWQSRQ